MEFFKEWNIVRMVITYYHTYQEPTVVQYFYKSQDFIFQPICLNICFRKTFYDIRYTCFQTAIKKLRRPPSNSKKQPPRGALKKRCSENMQQLYWNRTSAWCSPVNLLHIFRAPFAGTPLGGCFWIHQFRYYHIFHFQHILNIFEETFHQTLELSHLIYLPPHVI